jgi:hypothetical protein
MKEEGGGKEANELRTGDEKGFVTNFRYKYHGDT